MADVTSPPFVLVKPKILLGETGTEVEIQCGANQVEASPEQDESTVETFCGTYTTYKPEQWTITVGALQSFGAGGLWTNLRPMCNTVVPFELLPDASAAPSVDNPSMTGTCLVKGFPFLSGAVGEASEFDLELAVQGAPEWVVV